MRTKLGSLILAVSVAIGMGALAAPAQAKEIPVKAGKDGCGNYNVWINGQQLIYYVWCGPDPR